MPFCIEDSTIVIQKNAEVETALFHVGFVACVFRGALLCIHIYIVSAKMFSLARSITKSDVRSINIKGMLHMICQPDVAPKNPEVSTKKILLS